MGKAFANRRELREGQRIFGHKEHKGRKEKTEGKRRKAEAQRRAENCLAPWV